MNRGSPPAKSTVMPSGGADGIVRHAGGSHSLGLRMQLGHGVASERHRHLEIGVLVGEAVLVDERHLDESLAATGKLLRDASDETASDVLRVVAPVSISLQTRDVPRIVDN